MKAATIEGMEKKRFYYLLARIIIEIPWLGSLIWWSLFSMDIASSAFAIINCVLGLIFIVLQWLEKTNLEKIKKDKVLSAALNDEIYLIYKYKVFMTGFFCSVGCALLIFCFNWMLELSVQSACLIIIVVGAVPVDIHKLIIYKP